MKPDIPHKTFGIANRYLLIGLIVVVGIATISTGTLSSITADYVVGNGVYPVGAYGAVGDNSTDDTAAIRAAVADLVANGGGTLKFTSGKIYNVTGTLTTTGGYGSNALFNFTNVSGVTIDGAGATIRDSRTYTGVYPNGNNGTMFLFRNSSHVNIKIAVTGLTFPSDRVGFDAFAFDQGSYDINADVQVTGAVRAFYLFRLSSDPLSWMIHDVNVKLNATNSEYGVFADRGIYNLFVQSNLNRVSRGFFLIGVNNSKINQYEKNPQGANQIAVYGSANSSDIDIELINTETTSAIPSNYLMALQYSDQSPGSLRNIHIKLDTKNPISSPWFDTIQLIKLDNSGNEDSTGRGHVLEGLEITGTDIQYNNREHFSYHGNWISPDTQRNINVHDLYLNTSLGSAGSDFLFDAGALEGNINFENVYAPYVKVNFSNNTFNNTVVFKNVVAYAGTNGGYTQTYINSNFTSVCDTTTTNKRILFSKVCGTWYNIQ